MGNNNSKQEQSKTSPPLGEDIEGEKTITPVVQEKTNNVISKTRDPPGLQADGLFQSVCTPTLCCIGPCHPQASELSTKVLPETPSQMSISSCLPAFLKKQHGDHRVVHMTPDPAESPVRPLASEHKHPLLRESQLLTPASFILAVAPPPPYQHNITSQKAPAEPHPVEQKTAVRNPAKMTPKQSEVTNPDVATAPAKTQEPSKHQPITKATPGIAAASSGEGDRNIAGSPKSDKSLFLNLPPNFPLTTKTLKKTTDHGFEYNLKEQCIPPPPTPRKLAVARRTLNREPYSEAVKGPVTKVNGARREAWMDARVSRSFNKQARDLLGNYLTSAWPSQPSSNAPETPQVTSTLPVPQVTSTPPVPQVTSTPPVPQMTSTPPVPQVTSTPPVPQVTSTLPVPQVTSTPPVPQVTSTPPVPQMTSTPPVPQMTSTPPVPQMTSTPPVPQVTSTPPVPQVTRTPPVPQMTSIYVPKEKEEQGNQAQVKATDTQGTRISSNSPLKPASSRLPRCSSERRRAFIKTRLQLKSKAQPTDGNQVPPENTEVPPIVAKPPSEKKSSPHRTSTLIKEKESEADPLRTALVTFEAESKILMERFKKNSTEKPTIDSTQFTAIHSHSDFNSGYTTPDTKCPVPFFTMPKMVNTPMYSDYMFMEFGKSNPTTDAAVETRTNQSAASDVSSPTAPETAQGATTVTFQTQRREQTQSKAANQDDSNKATRDDDKKEERPDVEKIRTDEGPDEAPPEAPSRPEGLWHPFAVDRSCSRRANCQHNNTALPRNVTKWLNVSRNYLCEPQWVTTATLAASLALKERLGGGECVQ